MFRNLAEHRNILAEPLGSAEPRLKNTELGHKIHNQEVDGSNPTIYSLDVSDAIILKEK